MRASGNPTWGTEPGTSLKSLITSERLNAIENALQAFLVVTVLPPASTPGRVVRLSTDGRLYLDDGTQWVAQETTTGAQAKADAAQSAATTYTDTHAAKTGGTHGVAAGDAIESVSGAQAKANTAQTNAEAHADAGDTAINNARGVANGIATLDANAQLAQTPPDGSIGNAKLSADVARANLLANGGLEIWQRGAGPVISGYSADRWNLFIGTGSSFSVSKDTANADTDSAACAAITYTHAAGSDFFQKIEDIAQLKGRTISFSVRVKTATANAVRVGIEDSVNGTRLSGYHSGSGAYETLTIAAPVAAGATYLNIDIQLDASCTVYVDNAMLVVGDVAADYAPLHPADDLARCQRYYEIHGGATVNLYDVFNATGATENFGLVPRFAVPKAVTPTVTKNGTWTVTNCAQPVPDGVNQNGYRIVASSNAAGLAFFQTDTADDTVTAEANP